MISPAFGMFLKVEQRSLPAELLQGHDNFVT
jgi:hypothetical protein